MAIFLPQRWRRQPQYAVGINWGNPLTRGLCFLVVHSDTSARNLVSGKLATVSSGASRGAGVAGRTLIGGSTETAQWDEGAIVTSDGAGTGDFTLLSYSAPVSVADGSALIAQSGVSTSAQGSLFANTTDSYAPSAGTLGFYAYNGAWSNTTAAGVIDGFPHVFVGVRIGTTYSIDSDGVERGSTGGLTAYSILAGTTPRIDVEGFNGYANWTYPHPHFMDAAWNRALSNAERVEIGRNPWQLFQPTQRRIYFAAPAGGADTPITVPLATIVVAGAAPTVNRTQSVAVPAANVAVAAHAPTINQTRSVSVPLATIVVAGQTPTVNRTQSVAIPAADIVVAANAPSVAQQANTPITVPLSTIVVAAHAPTVNRIQSILVPVAPIIVNAHAPTLTQTGVLPAAVLAELYGGNIISKALADAKKGGRKKKREKEPLEEMVFEVAKTPEGKQELIRALPKAVQDELPVAQMALVSDLITKIEQASTQVQKKVERIYRQREEDDEDDVFILLM